MDRQSLLNALSGTLDPNQQTRKHCEEQLKVYEQQQGFTSYLLDILVESDSTTSVGIKVAAAIFSKTEWSTTGLSQKINNKLRSIY